MRFRADGLLLILLLAFLFSGSSALAHRLDEYLQAIRISVATNRIDFTIDLTPGVSVATTVIGELDTDRNGEISGSERDDYAHRVLHDLKVALDGKSLNLSFVSATCPAVDDLKEGVGTFRIRAFASVEHATSRIRALALTNTHLPTISVHLVNALVPRDPAVSILSQKRDLTQRSYRLEFRTGLARK